MRIDRVKLIAEMARQNIKAQDLAEKACVSRCTIVALRGGKSCSENSVKHVAAALGVTVEDLKGYHEVCKTGSGIPKSQRWRSLL